MTKTASAGPWKGCCARPEWTSRRFHPGANSSRRWAIRRPTSSSSTCTCPTCPGARDHTAQVNGWSVAIITGHDKPEYRARAVAAGVAAYLPKPIDDKELIGVIAAAARPEGEVKVPT